MNKLVFFAVLLFSSIVESAVLYNVGIEKLYVQSINGEHRSQAHAVKFNKAIHSSCNSRLYIDSLDKEVFSALLAYKMSNQKFDIMYEINKPSKSISGHLVAT
ncbi:hypothetical protein CW749_03130 [Vibrio sp. vnigr-6D03]|uniref:hypothetical protein n=1 Tax=Vibrio sp. vnigr-6D03 TaxID=2058088 RepID=UPI000C330AE0|nr:hypothetical protein [Vibrio sp. vnigr-6D03]PKF81644.1 hypothetical protein CW749_03130 [Vibrio sp. vnigr-6D03]